ncbi:MAG: 30S ribosomal protein S3 [Phycisphaerae bacterium]|nr:MAG: 30S ribosomal protein S3 [Planctomycetia bacterium]RIK70383.1 MAG: 30S ribosomal protein S3 [Planctomycetota bacterium]GJQ26921.1 MAG: 30S ribosomal protein S3 [Phycisphaerae bacterium]
MGQKTHPIGFRVGVTEDWRSRWYAPKAAYAEFLIEDQRIRKLIDEKLNRTPPFAGCAKVEIERTRNEVKVVLHTARPGMVIGPRGAEVDKLREAVEDLIDRKVSVNIVEIKNPDLNAQLIAQDICEQLKRRASFRRAMKQRCEQAIGAGALGVKVICKGRLGGAEMSRMETQKIGSIPLQTLDAHVDYGFATAFTTYGAIGVRVWLYKGQYGEEVDAASAVEGGSATAPRGRRARALRQQSGPPGVASAPDSAPSGSDGTNASQES